MVEDRRPDPLILSLTMDSASAGRLNALRRRHFPPERNVLDAHLTLFHALPGAEQAAIAEHLSRVCTARAPLELYFGSVRSLGRGVAVVVDCAELLALRAALAGHWRGRLSRQDAQTLRPHVTVQNKVAPAEAKALYENLRSTWVPFRGVGEGLSLWHYRGGPWEPAGSFPFAAAGADGVLRD